MSRKSIKKNYIYNLSYQILLLITPLITTPYLSRVLGADGIGIVSYAESIVSYFVLFGTLGITTFGQREISYVQEDKERRTNVFWEAKLLEFITAGSVLIIYLIFVLLQKENRIIYLFLAFNILSVFFDVTWFFQGMEEFKRIVIRNFFFRFISIGYIFLFVTSKNDLVWYAFGLAFFLFLSNLSLWLYLPKYIGKPQLKNIMPFRNIKTVLALFIPTIAFQIYTVLDKTMIGIITQSAFENGYYEQAMKISKMALMIVTALGTVMIPRIGYYFSKGDYTVVKAYMYRGYKFVWCIGIPICFGIIGISSNFVPWFFGNGFEKVGTLLGILSFLILAIGISNVTGTQYLIPTKREKLFTRTVVIGAIVNLILNAFLISLYESVGAAIASVMAETTITLVQLYIVRKELSVKQIFCSCRNYLVSGIIMFLLLKWLGVVLYPSILNTTIMILSGAVLYSALLCIIKDEFFLDNVKSIVTKIPFKK